MIRIFSALSGQQSNLGVISTRDIFSEAANSRENQLLLCSLDLVCAQKPSSISPFSPLPSTKLLAEYPLEIELSAVPTIEAALSIARIRNSSL